jgi:predicted RNase H-like HicB family nuclease
MKDFLNTDHCLAIAGAFIAIIGACATLVSIANSKSEALGSRYRDVTKEYRDEHKNSSRRGKLCIQIGYFADRVEYVYKAQRCLFIAIALFVLSILVFVGIGLYLAYIGTPNDTFYSVAQPLLVLIGLCVAAGICHMWSAIWFHFQEMKCAKATFENETSDCRPDLLRLHLQKAKGGYSLSCPGKPDCWFGGETKEEALRNIQYVIVAYREAEEEASTTERQFA